MNNNTLKKINNCKIGKETKILDFVNLYGCTIGDFCLIGPFVEIQKDVIIGNKVKVESHSFICSGVVIKNNVFIGHHVVFTNDRYPRSVSKEGNLKKESEWKLEKTVVEDNASIGSNVTILQELTIEKNAIDGTGSVVTKDVLADTIVAGNPAKIIRKITTLVED